MSSTEASSSAISSMSKNELSKVVSSQENSKIENISDFREEIERRVLNAEEVMDVYKGTVEREGEKVGVSLALLQKGIRESGIKSGNLGYANEIDSQLLDLSKEGVDEDSPNKPQVWFKQVERKVGRFGSKKEKTDEVLIITRLNNSDKEGESTVVVGLVKQIDGIPQIGKENAGVFKTLSENEYQEIIGETDGQLVEKPRKKLLKEVFTGEMQISQHRESFRRHMGEDYKEYWKKRDMKLNNSPDRWRAKENIGVLVESLNDDYQELLQETNTKYKEVVEETEKKRRELAEKQESASGFEKGEIEAMRHFVKSFERYKEAVREEKSTTIFYLEEHFRGIGIRDEFVKSIKQEALGEKKIENEKKVEKKKVPK